MCGLLYLIMQVELSGPIDSLRFLNSIHTTARQLKICTQIIKTFGLSNLPISLVESRMVDWSIEKEKVDSNYTNSPGKITERGKKTTALHHYIALCKELGLIKSLGNLFSNSRAGLLLLSLLPQNKYCINLSNEEIAIYKYYLLEKDADGILLALSIAYDHPEIRQKDVREIFLRSLSERLLHKQANALPIVRQLINEKYRTINFLWKNAKSYAEHIIVPRYEWLSHLGLINIEKGKNTNYSLTDSGVNFFESLPTFGNIKDINEEWINSNLFTTLNSVESGSRTFFSTMADAQKSDLLGESISNAIDKIKSSSSFKSPLFETVLYSCFHLYFDKNIIAEIKEAISILRKGLTHSNRNFSIKENARINESYILYR